MHHNLVRSFSDLRRISTDLLRSSLKFLGLPPCKDAGQLIDFRFYREIHANSQLYLLPENHCQNLQGALSPSNRHITQNGLKRRIEGANLRYRPISSTDGHAISGRVPA